MLELAEIAVNDLPRLVGIVNDVRAEERATVSGFEDWRRQAEDTIWLLAQDGGQDVGAGVGVHGWHSPPGVVRTLAYVPARHRRQGIGTALFRTLDAWALGHGARAVQCTAAEDDPASLRWLGQRGFEEVGRDSSLMLDLTAVAAPAVAPPEGVTVVTWAEHPELARGIYAVMLEAGPDVPGEEDTAVPGYDEWLEMDMGGPGDRPEAVFVALAGDRVVGFAKLALDPEDTERAYHDLTGVLRAWRGRGIASALKRAQIGWAQRAGYTRLMTRNEARNTPIRILNERHGYVLQPGLVTLERALGTAARTP